MRDGSGLSGGKRGVPGRPLKISRRGVRMASRGARLDHPDLSVDPGASSIDGLTRSLVPGLDRFEEIENVLGAVGRPQREQMVIRISEGPATPDRHEARVAFLGEDHRVSVDEWGSAARFLSCIVFPTRWQAQRDLGQAVPLECARFQLK